MENNNLSLPPEEIISHSASGEAPAKDEAPPAHRAMPAFLTLESNLPYGYRAQSAAAPLPSYEEVRAASPRASSAAKAAFVLGILAFLMLAFWLIYPPSGFVMTLLGLITFAIGLRLGRQARGEDNSNLAEAVIMINLVGLVASCAFFLLLFAACIGLIGTITTLL